MCKQAIRDYNEKQRMLYANMFAKFAEADIKVCSIMYIHTLFYQKTHQKKKDRNCSQINHDNHSIYFVSNELVKSIKNLLFPPHKTHNLRQSTHRNRKCLHMMNYFG